MSINQNTKKVITINEENIADVISLWTGIPAKKISEEIKEFMMFTLPFFTILISFLAIVGCIIYVVTPTK